MCAIKGGRMMKKIRCTDRPRPLQMCLASELLLISMYTFRSLHIKIALEKVKIGQIMRDYTGKDMWAIKGGRMMKKIGCTDRLRPLQMCLASNQARATIDGTSFDFHTNQTSQKKHPV